MRLKIGALGRIDAFASLLVIVTLIHSAKACTCTQIGQQCCVSGQPNKFMLCVYSGVGLQLKGLLRPTAPGTRCCRFNEINVILGFANLPCPIIRTPSPTSRPTKVPTSAPTTLRPTPVPTSLPTTAPTLSPTLAPTAGPTLSPTLSPTQGPTLVPTPAPTPQATAAPSNNAAPSQVATMKLAEKINMFYNEQKEAQDELREREEHTDNFEDALLDSISSRGLDVVDYDSAEGENLLDDLPNFVTATTTDPNTCKCVDCEEDEKCGGLWKGKRYPGTYNLKEKKIHIVVSHCMSDLDWIPDFTKGFNISSIHVITKCGAEVKGAPEMATIQVLPNIGRCDHTYAYYITTVIDQKMEKGTEDDSIVVFLKDDISAKNLHQSGYWNDFESLLGLSASDNGFACGIIPDTVEFGANEFYLSTYHETKTLFDFSMGEYSRNLKGYATKEEAGFKSPFDTLGEWYESLGAGQASELVQVCYGGVFSASVSNIRKRDMSVWKAVEISLSRGNNIQEGHFAERSWAGLLSTPLQPFQLDAVFDRADGVYLNKSSMHGALLKKPKLYIHVGVESTLSSSLLTESLVEDIDKLDADGYNVAVHGKWDGGKYGFPNVDRLGSCMWSDMNKSLFPDHLKDATVCPNELLGELADYMKKSVENSKDMVILNPWLVRQGSAEGLEAYLDKAWDTHVVIYYRRYFEWITFVFDIWRIDMMENSLSPTMIPTTSFRYIDFLREYCKRLFYGKSVVEDGFPVRDLSRKTSSSFQVSSTSRKVYSSHFDPTSNYNVEELTDLHEYTYFVAKQYYEFPRFRQGIEIVNFHDIRGPETNFYCHVLHDAHNACRAAIEREDGQDSLAGLGIKAEFQDFQQLNTVLPFKPSQALEEIAVFAYKKEILVFDETRSRKMFIDQIGLWMEMIKIALEAKNIAITDLPVECLFQFEIDRLLQVSLAYEKSLLPDFFASRNGADALQNDFAKWRFCSVDVAAVLGDEQWEFLFEDASNFTIPELPKAYIHIGAPKTGTTSIQDSMAMDRAVLEEDKYFIAVHGQLRVPGTTNYIRENMLVKCDALGACVWSDEQRQIVVEGSGDPDAGKCPDYLPMEFDNFKAKAIENKSDIVISNEWLNRPSSETGLLDILDGWDPQVVIFYRRFFDWMISAHYQWHFDLGIEALTALQGKVSLVDFIKMQCGRLFASTGSHTPDDADLSFMDLTDIQEYTYHAWKRYKSVPAYESNMNVVNFHDGQIVKSFYCDVLDAKNACELETKRLEGGGQEVKTRSKSSTKYLDLAIGLHWIDPSKLESGTGNEGDTKKEVTMDTFHQMADTFVERMTAKGLTEEDLPTNCLTGRELTLLLNVSLAYEKTLLPEVYESGGEEALRDHFAKTLAKGKFCAIDVDEVAMNSEWTFLYEGLN